MGPMLILVTLLLIGAVFFWYERYSSEPVVNQTNEVQLETDPDMTGFHGWLLWFAIAFGAFTTFMSYNIFFKYEQLSSLLSKKHSDTFFAVMGWNVLILFIVILSFLLMVRRSQYFPTLFLATVLLMLGWVPIELALVKQGIGTVVDDSLFKWEPRWLVVLGLIGYSVYIFTYSRRVKSTFVK
jgi:hypothetical protein